MIYLLIMMFLIIVHFLVSRGPSEKSTVVALSLFFLIFIGLRRDVGCDFDGYFAIFSEARGLSLSQTAEFMEVGFAALVRLVQDVGLDYYGLNLICAAVYLYGSYKLSIRQPSPSGFFVLSFPILILHMAMSATRQATAIGFLMLAIVAFVDEKRLNYVVLILLATSFHTSSVVFLPLVFLIGRPISIVKLTMIFVAATPAISFFAGESFETYQFRYIDSEVAAAGGPVRAAIVTAGGLMFFMALHKPWRVKYPRDYEVTRVLALLTLPLVPISLFSSVIADRFGYYLMPAQLMIFARAPYLRNSDAVGQLLSFAPWVLLVGFLAVWALFSPIASACYLPYDNYLF